MTNVRVPGGKIRSFILNNVEKHPADISKITADHFSISRQAVNKHLQRLSQENSISGGGNTRNRIYKLKPLLKWRKVYTITSGLSEDRVWRDDIQKVLGNVHEIIPTTRAQMYVRLADFLSKK